MIQLAITHPLHVAIYDRLIATPAVVALLATATSVFALRATEGGARPYVVIGSQTDEPAGVFSKAGSFNSVQLHVWGRFPDQLDVLQILDEIAKALSASPLTIAGVVARRGTVRTVLVAVDPVDGLAHGVAIYEALHVAA